MAEASSTSTLRTLMPSGGVCGVLSIMPRIWPAACSAAAGSSASLMPPALPRPPACTCALTTTLPPSRWAIVRACAGVSATSPFGTATPNSRSSALAWYSWIFIREGSQDQGHRSELTADRIERKAERLRSEEHTSELQSQSNLVCRLLLEKKKNKRLSSRYSSVTSA